jgi:phosphohistidine swiveling domain-containing protein
MELPADLKNIKTLKWAPYAGRNLTYFFTYLHLRDTYGKLYKKLIGARFSYLFCEGTGQEWQMYRSPSESERLEAFIYEKSKDSAYVQDLLTRIHNGYQKYRTHAERQGRLAYDGASMGQLAEALRVECTAYLEMLVGISCAIVFASALARRLEESAPADAVAQMALPLYMTLPLEEEIAFWNLVSVLQENGVRSVSSLSGLSADDRNRVQTHYDMYCWLNAYENDSVWRMDDLLARIQDAVGQDALKKVRDLTVRHDANERIVHDASIQNGISSRQLEQFRMAMHYRILGESLVGLANHKSRPLFNAIAKVLLLPRNQIKWFCDEELLSCLNGEISSESLQERLAERRKHYVIALGQKSVHAFQGKNAQAFLDSLDIEKPEIVDVTEVKGVSAYPGKVTGTARVVRHVGEIDKVQKDDILITLNTTPSFILAMKRSAAIVTDEGGITCHAAIVSRELGIPCIIGTKAGTRLIPDGAKIKVDATNGTVRLL